MTRHLLWDPLLHFLFNSLEQCPYQWHLCVWAQLHGMLHCLLDFAISIRGQKIEIKIRFHCPLSVQFHAQSKSKIINSGIVFRKKKKKKNNNRFLLLVEKKFCAIFAAGKKLLGNIRFEITFKLDNCFWVVIIFFNFRIFYAARCS